MEAVGKITETVTEDGLRLHGFLQISELSESSDIKKHSLWIVIHGVAGNFYNSSLLASVSETLLCAGHDVLRVNTRGRDAVCYLATLGGQTRGGAAYEQLSDSVLDLRAWVDLARSCGYQTINFLGHSLGAVKAILAYVSGYIRVEKLILLSPPRLLGNLLITDQKYGSNYQSDLDVATEAMKLGQPEKLMSIRFPQPMLISAATFIDKYAGDSDLGTDQYDYFRYLPELKGEVLFCFGEYEVRGPRVSFSNCDQLLSDAATARQNISIQIVLGGDHAYTGVRDTLQNTILDWLAKR